MAGPKIKFMQRVQDVATRLAQVLEDVDGLDRVYLHRGYNAGGANPVTDADLESHNVTAAQIAAFVTLCQQLSRFANNKAVTSADYLATVNALRTDL